jgi:hypothetical protein
MFIQKSKLRTLRFYNQNEMIYVVKLGVSLVTHHRHQFWDPATEM